MDFHKVGTASCVVYSLIRKVGHCWICQLCVHFKPSLLPPGIFRIIVKPSSYTDSAFSFQSAPHTLPCFTPFNSPIRQVGILSPCCRGGGGQGGQGQRKWLRPPGTFMKQRQDVNQGCPDSFKVQSLS